MCGDLAHAQSMVPIRNLLYLTGNVGTGLSVIVIGAGISGLKAAGDLQRAGAKVRLHAPGI